MDQEETSVLAGEYVLGLLGPDETRAVVARMARDPVLRAEIAAWQEDLGSLFAVEEVTPPARVGRDLRARIGAPDPAPEWHLSATAILVTKAVAILALSLLVWSLI